MLTAASKLNRADAVGWKCPRFRYGQVRQYSVPASKHASMKSFFLVFLKKGNLQRNDKTLGWYLEDQRSCDVASQHHPFLQNCIKVDPFERELQKVPRDNNIVNAIKQQPCWAEDRIHDALYEGMTISRDTSHAQIVSTISKEHIMVDFCAALACMDLGKKTPED